MVALSQWRLSQSAENGNIGCSRHLDQQLLWIVSTKLPVRRAALLICIVAQKSMEAEGKMLASTSYGAKILRTLGRIYELQAEIASGGESPEDTTRYPGKKRMRSWLEKHLHLAGWPANKSQSFLRVMIPLPWLPRIIPNNRDGLQCMVRVCFALCKC